MLICSAAPTGHKHLPQNCTVFEAGILEVSCSLIEELPITIANDQREEEKKSPNNFVSKRMLINIQFINLPKPSKPTWGWWRSGNTGSCRERAAGEHSAFCLREAALWASPLPRRAPEGALKHQTHNHYLHTGTVQVLVWLHLQAFPLHPPAQGAACALHVQQLPSAGPWSPLLMVSRVGQGGPSACLLVTPHWEEGTVKQTVLLPSRGSLALQAESSSQPCSSMVPQLPEGVHCTVAEHTSSLYFGETRSSLWPLQQWVCQGWATPLPTA